MSNHLATLSPSAISVSKLSGKVVSSHKLRSGIVGTTDDLVKLINVVIFIREINLEDWVTPATKIPIIKITIDNSINENARFCLRKDMISKFKLKLIK